MPSKMSHKIKKFRKQWGLTLDALAVQTDSSKSYIWGVENKDTQPSPKKLVAIAEALKTTPDFLLDDTKEEMTLSDEEDRFFRKYRSLTSEDRKKMDQIIDIFNSNQQ